VSDDISPESAPESPASPSESVPAEQTEAATTSEPAPVEAPTEPAVPVPPAAAAAAPVAAAAAAAPTPPPAAASPVEPAPTMVAPAPPPTAPPGRKGVFVPLWVGALVLVLAVAALAFGIGRWTADDSQNASSVTANNGGIVPQLPNGNNGGVVPQNPNGNNGGNGSTTPSTTAFLGVGVDTGTNGVTITTVGDGSPAANAGLKQGDVITAIDNTTVTTPTALRSAIQSHKPGDSVTVHYTRNGTATTVKVTLGSQSQ
jgi:membrane-associated protease RseP (regulator of RpoE activity)